MNLLKKLNGSNTALLISKTAMDSKRFHLWLRPNEYTHGTSPKRPPRVDMG